MVDAERLIEGPRKFSFENMWHNTSHSNNLSNLGGLKAKQKAEQVGDSSTSSKNWKAPKLLE